MRIPLLDLKAQYESIAEEVNDAIVEVMTSQRFILGPQVSAFEEEVARYAGVPHAVGLSSGSDAILVALTALGVKAGDEVITTDYSFFATVGSIARMGARPVLIDIEADGGFQIDAEAAASRVNGRTAAILAVHLFGRCCATEKLAAACAVPIVEDAAQAIGASRHGRRSGALGAAGCFSFFPSKNLGGCGDGGMLVTTDAALAERARALRVHGQPAGQRNRHEMLGGNFRLDALQAAILRVKLRHLDEWTEARRRNAARYRDLFAQADAGVRLPPPQEPGCRHVYNQFVIRVAAHRRDALRAHLADQGIGSAVYYPFALHQQPCLAALGYGDADFPHAVAAASENLSLPVFPELTPSQQDEVVGRICDFLRS